MTDPAVLAGLFISLLANVGQLVAALRKSRTDAAKATAETDGARSATAAAADTSAIGHWREYATELHDEIKRLNRRLDATQTHIADLVNRERECQINAARQDEKIRGLECEVGELRALLDAHGRRDERGP